MLTSARPLDAETGYSAWLRYTSIHDKAVRDLYDRLPATVVRLDGSPEIEAAQNEMIRGLRGILGRILRAAQKPAETDMVLLATIESLKKALPTLLPPTDLQNDGYWLKTAVRNGHSLVVIAAPNDRGVLYGTFALLQKIALHLTIDQLNEKHNPYAPVRWVNQWDNLDGSVERGYAGRSIFFESGGVVKDLGRVADYARLLASVGVNGCAVNNVNANPLILSSSFLRQLARIADAFRPWGVKLSIAVDFSSPKTLGGLDTFDPLSPAVAQWWQAKVDEIYKLIPDFSGFVLKADSEGRLGPSAYGRTPAQAANVIARALKPHGGILLYRAFVYNHHLDWRDPKADRARAAYDVFHPLDGKFDDNVIIQIKYGPIDFQVREPVSPLIGGLEKTNQSLEWQITQEYTGQQRHVCYLVPMWKEVLDFDLRVNSTHTPVKEIVSGNTFHRPLGGFVGVANIGRDTSWLGSDLAMANLYGFGRLAWDPNTSAAEIATEWTRLTFGDDPLVVQTVTTILLESWHVYENYTGPLGLGTLTDIFHSHYGPGIESAERNGWGQWIRANSSGVGMDRTVATGTGYIGQYPPAVARIYESLQTTPDKLLLFMHHVPYTYVLHSGQSAIQYIYDSHYAGAAEAQEFPRWWKTLQGRIDEQRYERNLLQLEYQAGHAIVWRDAICNWFLRESGISDAKARVGHYPNRIEAESMKLDGYAAIDVEPWEDASAGKAIQCEAPRKVCSASFAYQGKAGWYNLSVQYFDLNRGAARFALFRGDQKIDEWVADAELPSSTPNGDTSTRRTITGLALRPGDEIRIEGTANGGDTAALDYIEITPARE